HKAATQRVELSKPADMLKSDVTILASPTYGHGVLQGGMEVFCQALKDFPLKNHPCAVIGIGDPKYEAQYHMESAPILEEAITHAGGKQIIPALRISGTPVHHLDGLIPNWTQKLIEVLK
ncbi:MAG: flavodoxin domain-containing protein, partial [Candidatus Peregrinibacteria bacterium]